METEEHELVDEPPPAAQAYLNATGRRRSNVFQEAVVIEQGWRAPTFPKTAEEIKRLDGYVGETALLKHLDLSLKTTVVQAFEKKTFGDGEAIITQGESGDYYYILDQGSADVFIKKDQGSEIKVNHYDAGGAFGELALLHGDKRRATVRASGPCTTWALDRDTFRKIMMQTGKSEMSERVAFLDKVSILDELTAFEKFKIAEAMEVREAREGEVIVTEGDDGHDFFIIRRGACHCYKSSK